MAFYSCPSDMYARIRQQIPLHLQDSLIHCSFPFENLGASMKMAEIMAKVLPCLPVEAMHQLCQMQEKAVMNKLVEVRQVNLIEEISKVCPKQSDIRTISSEEVLTRINDYNSKLSIEHDDISSASYEEEDRFDEEANLQENHSIASEDVENREEVHNLNTYAYIRSIRTMRDVFEEYEHHQENAQMEKGTWHDIEMQYFN